MIARRLAAQSIVNTITANRPDVSVQLLFELNGSAARVRRTELGLETFGGGSHDPDVRVTVTPLEAPLPAVG